MIEDGITRVDVDVLRVHLTSMSVVSFAEEAVFHYARAQVAEAPKIYEVGGDIEYY